MKFKPDVLLEDKKSQLLAQAKQGANYKDTSKGKNRYERRKKSKLASSVKNFNAIDMDKFFKSDILDVSIDVKGETNNYTVRISFLGTLNEIHNFQNKPSYNEDAISRKTIARSLSRAFMTSDVYFNCTCADFCLHPDTSIKLLNGETISVEELSKRFSEGESFWVYSTDEYGDFKPGKISDVWITDYTNEFIKITLDNDEQILTTPNHLYMLRDGSYKRADELSENDSLMPLYFKINSKGYEDVKLNSTAYPTKFVSVYKTVADECLSNEIEAAKVRSGEDIIAIHHSDFNKLNNNPENLVPMGKDEHWKYHSNHVHESGVLDKFIQAGQLRNQRIKNRETDEYEFQAEVMRKAIKEYNANLTEDEKAQRSERLSKQSKAMWANPESKVHSKSWHDAAVKRGKAWHTPENNEKTRQGLLRYYQGISDEEKKKKMLPAREAFIKKYKGKPHSEEHNRRKKEGIRKYYDNMTADQKALDIRNRNITKIGNIIQKIIDNGEIPSPETYAKYKTNGYPNYTKVFSSWSDVTEYYNLNHKVKSVQKVVLEEPVPVYDLTVDKWSNFLLGAGVVVHNCYRHKFHATKKDNLIGDPETRPIRRDVYHAGGLESANYYDNQGPACKHVILALQDSSWLIKVTSVIYNYIQYMKDHREREYQKYIYPAIYQEPYPAETTQLDLTDIEPERTKTEDNIDISEYQEIVDDDLQNNNGKLSVTTRALIDDAGLSLMKNPDGSYTVRGNKMTTSPEELNKAIKLGRERGLFKPGNKYRFKKKIKDNQEKIDFDKLEKDLD